MPWLIYDPKNVRNEQAVERHEALSEYYSENQTWVDEPKIYPEDFDSSGRFEVDVDLEYLNRINLGLRLKKFRLK